MHSPFDLSKPIAIGSDHAGYDYKEELISFLAPIAKILLIIPTLPIPLHQPWKTV
jgi:hypothetical protein